MNELRESHTLNELLRLQALHRPEAIALIYGDRLTNFTTLDQHACKVANGLVGLGIRRHDRVGYLGRNSDAYFELLFGTAKAGAALVPINWRLAAPEIAMILADAGVTTLFLGKGFSGIPAALDLPLRLRCISIDGASEEWPDFAAWRDAQSSADPMLPADPEDTVLQMYTSGTTGLPKGVELSHRNYLAVLVAAEALGAGGVGPDDVLLMCMPAFHVAGTNIGLIGLAHGSTVVVMEEFNPGLLADIIPRHGVTFLFLVPAAILMLVQHPASGSADFSSVRNLGYGASPISEALVEQARIVFPNAGFWHAYGLTEATGGGTLLPPEAHDPSRGKLRSCGKPYPGFELRIVDRSGQDVARSHVGEIVLRSAAVMKGYWNNPEATRAAFFTDGWLRTGDAAYKDEEGFIYVHDRVKDMIISGGENVYPAEVENALFGHFAIADVAVIGVPDPRWGEAVKAIVVLRPGQQVTAEEIIVHARQCIAGYKVPKSVDFVDALPRNASGKVLRRMLRAPYWEGHDRQVN
jgi:acyl-CoA synthetase (AMP-forming)/AMP-acid ligase II